MADENRDWSAWFFFATADGRIYVGQYNGWAADHPACRLLDPITGRFDVVPSGCILPSGGLHYRARSLGRDWIEILSSSEGWTHVELARWDPVKGKHVDLDIPRDGYVDARLEGDAVLIASRCDLTAPDCGPSDVVEKSPSVAIGGRRGRGSFLVTERFSSVDATGKRTVAREWTREHEAADGRPSPRGGPRDTSLTRNPMTCPSRGHVTRPSRSERASGGRRRRPSAVRPLLEVPP